jgi:NO-binding membrane sensor protein with MHYT domain
MVAASFAVALFAGFSGLSPMRGASRLAPSPRKMLVAVAAVVLGGGIWSMHFVAMLGLQLPILFFYDGLTTLISALVAILMVGLALLMLHFGARNPAMIIAAGCVIGAGIVRMHYIGMPGMELCGPVFAPFGVGLALVAALSLSSLVVWVAYGARSRGNILLGTAGFAGAAVSVPFIAMAGTPFYAVEDAGTSGPALGNAALAMIVALSSFVISGASLLSGVPFFDPAHPATTPAAPGPEAETEGAADTAAPGKPRPVPYERDGRTHFADPAAIAAIRAEGHCTVLYRDKDKLFCPWSISEAATRLGSRQFIRVHRSYLINPAYVSEFRRTKDTGICFFETIESLPKVPVSRSRLADLRRAPGV